MASLHQLRSHYMLTEIQVRSYLRRALRGGGPPFPEAVRLLELRLDNVAYRLGFAGSIGAARRMILHGHVLLNGRRVNRPARQVRPGDEIALRRTARGDPLVRVRARQEPALRLPSFLRRSGDGLSGRCVASPVSTDLPAYSARAGAWPAPHSSP